MVLIAALLVLIAPAVFRYLTNDRAKRQAIRKDLILLEKEVFEINLQYKTIDQESDQYLLVVSGSERKIQVDRNTYEALQAGQRLRLSRSRYAQVIVGYENINGQ